jgi:hypothetical protein
MEKQIGVLAPGSLARGMLVDKPPGTYPSYTEAEITKVAAAVKEIK